MFEWHDGACCGQLGTSLIGNGSLLYSTVILIATTSRSRQNVRKYSPTLTLYQYVWYHFEILEDNFQMWKSNLEVNLFWKTVLEVNLFLKTIMGVNLFWKATILCRKMT